MRQLSKRGTMTVASTCFFALGIITAALGPALPDLAAKTANNLVTLGSVFTALFLGSLLTQLIAGPITDRIGQRPILSIGLLLLALGTLGMVTSPWLPLTLTCAIIAGLGHGAIDISTNVLIAEVFAQHSTAALNLLNVFYGAGAVAGPALAGLMLRLNGTALPALWVGIGLIILVAPFIPRLIIAPRLPHTTNTTRPQHVYRSLLLWTIGILLFTYVGAENGIGGWTTTYLLRTTGLDMATAALATSGFWLALTCGRIAGVILGTRLTPAALLLMSLVGALSGAILQATAIGDLTLTIIAILIIGLCFGPIFPTAFAIITTTFRQNAGTAASIVIALGSLGGMLFPPLQGFLLERTGPPSSAILIVSATLIMVLLRIGFGKRVNTPSALAEPHT